MKQLSILLLAITLSTSCKKEKVEEEPQQNQTTNNTTTTNTSFQYDETNITGYWELDSVFTHFTQVGVTEDPVMIYNMDFTMEIYRINDNDEKTSSFEVGDYLEVDDRPHGSTYGGLPMNTLYDGEALTSVPTNEEEQDLYNVGCEQFRIYQITDIGTNQLLTVTAEDGWSGVVLIEYFHRVK